MIEARFVKPVYDGETADVTGDESDGVLSIEVESRGQLCATGTRLASRLRAVTFDLGFPGNRAGERTQAGERSLLPNSANGSGRCRGHGRARPPRISEPRCASAIRSMRREGLGHPGLLQRVMNKVLVDNAILGPWIHVGSRMQLLKSARSGDELTAPRQSDRQLREEGPSLRRARRTRRRQRHDAARPLPAHRDLPAARAGGGVGFERAYFAATLPAVIPRECA